MEIEEEILAEVSSAAAATAGEAPSETPAAVEDQPIVEEKIEESIEENPEQDFYKIQYENLQKDYTRKAQELAELKKPKPSEPKAEEPEWAKPDWQPKTWQEAIEAGKQAALKEVAPDLQEARQSRQQREFYAQAQAAVNAEVTELKALDPKLDEQQVFKHANKYGFTSLKAAYQNLVDMRGLEKTTQAKVLKNLKDRSSDPVGVSGATSPEDDTPSYQEISGYRSIRQAASAAYRSLKKE